MKRKARDNRADEMPVDVSDMAAWGRARRIVDVVNAKVPARRVTLNLDVDIIAAFKAEALQGGPPYQVAINQALRSYLRQRERTAQESSVEIVSKALDDPEVRRKIRQIR